MSKETILQDCHKAKVLNWDKVFRQNPTIIESAYEAMDIHAKNTAIEFQKWVKKWWSISKGKYRHRGDFYANDKLVDESKLYELFLQSKTPPTHE